MWLFFATFLRFVVHNGKTMFPFLSLSLGLRNICLQRSNVPSTRLPWEWVILSELYMDQVYASSYIIANRSFVWPLFLVACHFFEMCGAILSLFKIHWHFDLFLKFTLQFTTPPLNPFWLLPIFLRFVVHKARTMLPFLNFTFVLKNVFACRDQFKVDISVFKPQSQITQ